MSRRYVNSPALQLRIGDSRLRALLHSALCLCVCYAVWSIYILGYPASSVMLMALAAMLLWRLRRDGARGALLCWQDGLWTLERNGTRRVIALNRRCLVTPWAIYLRFSNLPGGATDSLWLFADSAPPAGMRQLRVRLTLLQ